jgi:hypothetical protein
VPAPPINQFLDVGIRFGLLPKRPRPSQPSQILITIFLYILELKVQCTATATPSHGRATLALSEPSTPLSSPLISSPHGSSRSLATSLVPPPYLLPRGALLLGVPNGSGVLLVVG